MSVLGDQLKNISKNLEPAQWIQQSDSVQLYKEFDVEYLT